MVDLLGDNLAGAVARRGGSWQILKPNNPAAGVAASIAPPGQHYYVLRLGQVTFTNSATVAVGSPVINLVDGDGTVIFTQSTGTALAAGASVTVSFGVSIGINSTANAIAIPEVELPPGLSWQFSMSAGLASVQVSNLRAWVDRVPYGDGGRLMTGLPPEEA